MTCSIGIGLVLVIDSLQLINGFDQSTCDSMSAHWWPGSMSCFQETTAFTLNFYQASRSCRDNAPSGARGRLAILNTEPLWKYLIGLFTKNSWIGLKASVSGSTSNCGWRWWDILATGNPQAARCVDYLPPMESWGTVGEDCAFLDETKQKTSADDCAGEREFMCEYMDENSPVETAPTSCAICCANPCQNGGWCSMEGVLEYSCNCPPTFTDHNCNTCDSSLCGNNCHSLAIDTNTPGGIYWPYDEDEASCFYIMDDVQVTWSEGMALCDEKAPSGTRGRLAVLDTKPLSTYIINNMIDDIHLFIGLRTTELGSTDLNDWNFYDGTNMSIASCVDSDTMSIIGFGGGKDCVKIDLPIWKAENCDGSKAIICEFLPEDILYKDLGTCHPVCLSNPCQHSGTCIDEPGKYTCTCTGNFYGTDCEFECPPAAWSTWTSCSTTAGYGSQMRYRKALEFDPSDLSNPCPVDPIIKEYQQCYTTESMEPTDSAPKSVCTSLSGIYTKPACFFVVTSSGPITWDQAHNLCKTNGARLAIIYDIKQTMENIGSFGLSQVSGTTVWISLKANTGTNSVDWMAATNQVAAAFSGNFNLTMLDSQMCTTITFDNLVNSTMSQLNTWQNLNPNTLPCNSTLISMALCMIDQWSAGFSAEKGVRVSLVTTSPVLSSAETNWMCGLQCIRMHTCQGFNYKESDLSCELLPVKGSTSMNTTYWNTQTSVYTKTIDSEWNLYNRID